MLNKKSITNNELIDVQYCEASGISISPDTNNSGNSDDSDSPNNVHDSYEIIDKDYAYDGSEDSTDESISNSSNDENKENFQMEKIQGRERSSSPLLVESKIQNPDLQDNANSLVVKKRGRPRKQLSATIPPKGPHGTPKKIEIITKRRGRGRPRKIWPSSGNADRPNKTLPAIGDDNSSFDNCFPNKTYCGRGRPPRGYVPPPKTPKLPKRPRGRPRIVAHSTPTLELSGAKVYSGRGRPPRGYVPPPKPPKGPRGRPRLSGHSHSGLSRLSFTKKRKKNVSDSDEEDGYVDVELLDYSNDDEEDTSSYKISSASDKEFEENYANKDIKNTLIDQKHNIKMKYSTEIFKPKDTFYCKSKNSTTEDSDNNESNIDENNTLIFVSSNLFRNKNLKRKLNGLPKSPKQFIKDKQSIYNNSIINTISTIPTSELCLTERVLKKRGRKSNAERLAKMENCDGTTESLENDRLPITIHEFKSDNQQDTDDSLPNYLDLELDSQLYDNNEIYGNPNFTQPNSHLTNSIVISDSEDETDSNHDAKFIININAISDNYISAEKNNSEINVISLVSEDSDSDSNSTSVSFEDDDEELLAPINNSVLHNHMLL